MTNLKQAAPLYDVVGWCWRCQRWRGAAIDAHARGEGDMCVVCRITPLVGCYTEGNKEADRD